MTGQQLKNSILQLAIQGKLVPQDPNDEPASELLKRIRKEKEQLVKAGKLKKKDLEVTPIVEDEKPFEIPESWKWVRVKDIAMVGTGSTPDTSNHNYYSGNVAWINSAATNNPFISSASNYITELALKETNCTLYEPGTIIVAMYGQGKTRGQVSELLIKAATNQACAAISCILPENKDYVKCFFIGNYISMRTLAVGGAQPNLNLTKIASFLIPLPPLAEQKRIVAKIEELLPLVEEYGNAQDELNKLNATLPDKLRQSILQEAIMGKLVPQDPNDEPASKLLERIQEEKKRLVKEGKLKKKDLEVIPINDDEKPFDLPNGWEWCRLGEIGIFERGNGIKRDETYKSGYPCVRYGEMYTQYRYAPTFDKTISFTSKGVFEKCRKAHKGDLFMALTGENKEDIALAAQYIGEEEIAVGGDLCHFTILQARAIYFVYLINSFYFKAKKQLLATGDIIVHISADKLGSIPIPLPPLAEQHRIVAKLEEILPKLNDLK